MDERTKTLDKPKKQGRGRIDRQRSILLAEQRLGRLEALLRNISVNNRMKTRQKLLQRSIEQQHLVIADLKRQAQTHHQPPSSRATRYVLLKPRLKTESTSTSKIRR